MVWSNTSPKADSLAYCDTEFDRQVPLPKYQSLKVIEQQACALAKVRTNLRVHIVCSGFLYGNGEQNDIFYEFFRTAWVSLHPQLAALPVVNGGNNHLPTIHVKDLSNILERIIVDGHGFNQNLIAVDDSGNQTQKEFMQSISDGIGNGTVNDITIGQALTESWCDFMTINVKFDCSSDL